MSHSKFTKSLVATVVAGLFLPAGAYASEADIQKKIENLNQQLEQLKLQVQKSNDENKQASSELKDKVQKAEDKSTNKWLTIGGDYQFRMDNLRGETKPFVDVSATFANAQFSAMTTGTPTLASLMTFSQGMAGVSTYDEAKNFMAANAATVGGLMPYAASVPAYKPKNNSLYTNRFGLDLNMKATQDVSVTARLLMYKTFGADDEGATTNRGSAPFFSDRVGVFDGTVGHVPSSSYLNVDRVYASLNNIADEDMWFSVGRRPSTNGAPTNLKNNQPRPGSGGAPALLVDYAFDGMVLGWAPDIDGLPGAFGKICYGRGFESGFSQPTSNSLKDTDMLGVSIVPIDTDPMRVWMQWNRGTNIFDAPKMNNTYFGNTMPKTNLGDIDWYGMGAMGTIKAVGPGNLNWFADAGMSVTHPNNNVSSQFGFQGLMTGGFFSPEAPTSKTGHAFFLGLRYDLPSKTMLGVEYNHGSKDWITFAPAAADSWTSKVGTRGNVYEAYLIQEMDKAPISSRFAKSFFRFGVQYYDFQYSGSNNWVGSPVKLSEMAATSMQTLTPVTKAYNVYASIEVQF